jgi:hypothetical protein
MGIDKKNSLTYLIWIRVWLVVSNSVQTISAQLQSILTNSLFFILFTKIKKMYVCCPDFFELIIIFSNFNHLINYNVWIIFSRVLLKLIEWDNIRFYFRQDVIFAFNIFYFLLKKFDKRCLFFFNLFILKWLKLELIV